MFYFQQGVCSHRNGPRTTFLLLILFNEGGRDRPIRGHAPLSGCVLQAKGHNGTGGRQHERDGRTHASLQRAAGG